MFCVAILVVGALLQGAQGKATKPLAVNSRHGPLNRRNLTAPLNASDPLTGATMAASGDDGAFELISISDALPEISSNETMQERIVRITADLSDLKNYYDAEISPTRSEKLLAYYDVELKKLETSPFDSYPRDGQVDYVLLRNWLQRQIDLQKADDARVKEMSVLLPFAPTVIALYEARQDMKLINAQKVAQNVSDINDAIQKLAASITKGNVTVDSFIASRALKAISGLQINFRNWYTFYNGYDPMFTWWVQDPFNKSMASMSSLTQQISATLITGAAGGSAPIVGQPIGRDGMLAELKAEMIVYTPEEIMRIADAEYAWCLAEMKKASQELGFGENWKAALEQVKNDYVEPGKQPDLIRKLALEAIDFVKEHDMITVPELAATTWRAFMMEPNRQKTSPFFLGGDDILISYPTNTMAHQDKLMSMRGNNPHFARATVFHELIPGHKLQFYSLPRYKPYRQAIGDTPFWIEGWAFYWELVLYNDTLWENPPQDRIGQLVWHMHRSARILFSVQFHLGKLTPQECIDLLVDMVGWDRANAEGEVRRSLNGDYSPLYQAGYMLGALQFRALRKELVDSGKWGQKAFHDRVMRENMMPVELLRAVLDEEQPLTRNFTPSWKFYGDV